MNKKEDKSNTKKQDKTEPSEERNETSIAAETLGNPNDEPVTKSTESKATPPHDEQLRYWNKDVRLKQASFLFSVIGFVVIACGIWFNASQISISTEQLKLNTRLVQLNTDQSERLAISICYSLQSDALAHLFNMDKVFIERAYLRPYFYESKDIDDKDKRYQEVLATAEMMLDLFDVVSDFNDPSKKYKGCWDDSESWDVWIVDTFSASPILRKTMEERRDWYAGNLWVLYQKALEKK